MVDYLKRDMVIPYAISTTAVTAPTAEVLQDMSMTVLMSMIILLLISMSKSGLKFTSTSN